MPNPIVRTLEGGSRSPLGRAPALALADAGPQALADTLAAAAARRDRAYGALLTYSPKVFLPLTNLCRNHCDYCTFRRSSGEAGAWTMGAEEVEAFLARGARAGALEALLCLGDKPETAFSSYRRLLSTRGHRDTTDLVAWAARRALDHGLLAHANAGVLARDELARLRPVNASLGLMLENISPRLCEPGMPHHRARDKRPELRMQVLRDAGELRIPFTTGVLIGIGETRLERLQSLLAIREVHERYGHIQEVIVQSFRAKPEIAMAGAPEPPDLEAAETVAWARLILPDEVSVQAPPNLHPAGTALLVEAGLNDFGGISPVTPDFINPERPWPHLESLYAQCEGLGFTLEPRLPVYDRFIDARWIDGALLPRVRAARTRLRDVRHPRDLVPSADGPTDPANGAAETA